ncbi:alkaline phosphatase D family protein [Haliea sp. E1-2-M8]|uniref:alkaline phosphatase D family protein n=1 Tax=Haliea sp. E1-2-M8 TaxID=3064706 RepID=UPI002728FB8D|nr:alkaline phosphatase D family protein [Haliea sp. E1-2-M8]MDO8861056.1 alkaline phosphatase D family protein [Haliea sp. E1-2-M8]
MAVSTALGGCQPLQSRGVLSAARFEHGVASGDPGMDSVLLWTRATPPAREFALDLAWELAEDDAFDRVIRRGEVRADAGRDYTVKVEVRDLNPGTEYFYRFAARDSMTAVGRSKTLPAGGVQQVRLAVFSCSNYPAGYFHVYREGSRLANLDAFLHLGDYLYEYGTGGYATENAEQLGRSLSADNAEELYSLADYRKRYALYRTDPDLQAMHAAAPCIAVWDDHEIANDTWLDGAENHSAEEGDFGERKLAALRAWYEWLPVRPPIAEGNEQIYRSFDFADLLSLHMLDTRIIGRDRQLEYRDYVDSATGDMDQDRFRHDLGNPERSLLGASQLAWLGERFAASNARWQLLGQQVLMAKMHLATASVSSPGMEKYLSVAGEEALQLAEAMTLLVEELQYCNLHQRGFMLLTVTPGALEADWLFVDTISERDYQPGGSHRVVIAA